MTRDDYIGVLESVREQMCSADKKLFFGDVEDRTDMERWRRDALQLALYDIIDRLAEDIVICRHFADAERGGAAAKQDPQGDGAMRDAAKQDPQGDGAMRDAAKQDPQGDGAMRDAAKQDPQGDGAMRDGAKQDQQGGMQ